MRNKITILGVYGTKSQKGGSTAFLLNKNSVIDAGNLLLPLGEKSIDIEAVWLTHSHLDHISDIAFIIDNYFEKRTKPLKIYALAETLEIVQKHFFNNKIWPDFSKIPLLNGKGMTILYHPLTFGEEYMLDDNSMIEAIATDHTVPSCGYSLSKNGTGIVITSDTYTLDAVIKYLNSHPNISALVVECSFPSSMKELAIKSKHLTSEYLFDALSTLIRKDIAIYINHMKPQYEDQIREEIEKIKGSWNVTILKDGDDIFF